MLRLLVFVLVMLAALPAELALAQTGRRVVLAVGIGGYQYQSRLSATPNDARLVAGTLAGIGFELSGGQPLVDPDKRRFDAALSQFAREIQGAEIAVFYYSGHGMQIDGRNWMIPTDGRSTRPADLGQQHVGLHTVLALIEQAKPKLALVILDACRNNPNQQVATRAFGTADSPAPGPGLAAVQAPAGTVVAFATAPDSVSLDGPAGGYSPYTEQLIRAIRQPGLDMFRVFNTAAVETRRLTNGQQNPWVSYSPIEGEFFFVGRGATPPATAAPALPPPGPPQGRQQATLPAPQQPALPAPAPAPAPAAGNDPSFYLLNLSGRRLADLRASLATDTSWGQNRLDQAGLASAARFGITLPSGQACTVDLRVVPQGEKPTEIRNTDTCQSSFMVLTPELRLMPA
ncbi:MAG: caspase family protein, partial [Acetobacteraceae bacterium]|nr:caspase family protein [Acetobacteraceae bacterium]